MNEGDQLLKGVIYSPERDQQISQEVLSALQVKWQMDVDNISVSVVEGCVTLDGSLPWNYRLASAEQIIGNLKGVKSVINNLVVQSDAKDAVKKMEIENALKRNWAVGHSGIHVHVCDNQVTLTGTVQSPLESVQAVKTAEAVSGLQPVINNLQIIAG